VPVCISTTEVSNFSQFHHQRYFFPYFSCRHRASCGRTRWFERIPRCHWFGKRRRRITTTPAMMSITTTYCRRIGKKSFRRTESAIPKLPDQWGENFVAWASRQHQEIKLAPCHPTAADCFIILKAIASSVKLFIVPWEAASTPAKRNSYSASAGLRRSDSRKIYSEMVITRIQSQMMISKGFARQPAFRVNIAITKCGKR